MKDEFSSWRKAPLKKERSKPKNSADMKNPALRVGAFRFL